MHTCPEFFEGTKQREVKHSYATKIWAILKLQDGSLHFPYFIYFALLGFAHNTLIISDQHDKNDFEPSGARYNL